MMTQKDRDVRRAILKNLCTQNNFNSYQEDLSVGVKTVEMKRCERGILLVSLEMNNSFYLTVEFHIRLITDLIDISFKDKAWIGDKSQYGINTIGSCKLNMKIPIVLVNDLKKIAEEVSYFDELVKKLHQSIVQHEKYNH